MVNNALEPVTENAAAYGKFAKEVINAFELYDQSVDTIVNVWKEMLRDQDALK